MDVSPTVFDVEIPSFQSDVVERSKEVPVILLFWTDQVAPAAETKHHLEALASQYGGKFALSLSDVAKDPQLAQQLRVQGIPSIRVVVDGQIADQIEGPQGEATLRELIDSLTMSGTERLKEELETYIAAQDWDAALGVLQQVLAAEPNNVAFKVEWADVLVRKGDIDDARTVLATIPEDTPERDRPSIRLELSQAAAAMDAKGALSRVEANGADLEARYEAAVTQAVAGHYAEALDQCMAILQADRDFRDDVGRTTMIRIMGLMGKNSEVAQQYRRRMFAYMH